MVTRTRTALHRAALAYAERGNAVHPLGRRSKIPLKGTNSFYSATTDVDQINEWWGREPEANIGWPTGARGGRVVIEIDPRNGGDDSLADLEAENGPLPETPRVLSGRGDGGVHYYFRHPGPGVYIKSRSGELAPGIDVKADGGQVVAPPSIHRVTGQPYRWDAGAHIDDMPLADLPDWLLAKLTKPKARPAADATSDNWTIPEGQRNSGLLSIAGRMRRQGFNEEEIAGLLLVTNRHRCQPPLPDDEVLAIVRSVCRYAPSDVPNFSEEAEESARKDADRLRRVIGARHDFTASVPLTATQKDVALTVARILPTLPANEDGEVRLCAAYVAKIAGCSRGTVASLNQTLERARVWTLRHRDEYHDGKVQKAIYVRLADGVGRTEDAFLDAIIRAPIEAKPRGGARTKSITLRPVAVENLLCPVHGDAGAMTDATTYCTAHEGCGLELHRHAKVLHPAGWLTVDDDPDPDGGPDAQPLTHRDTDSSSAHFAPTEPPGDALMFKFEHQNEWQSDAIREDQVPDAGDDLDVFGPVAVEDEDDPPDLSPLVADQIGDIIDTRDLHARLLIAWEERGRPPVPIRPGEIVTDLEKWLALPTNRDGDLKAVAAALGVAL